MAFFGNMFLLSSSFTNAHMGENTEIARKVYRKIKRGHQPCGCNKP